MKIIRDKVDSCLFHSEGGAARFIFKIKGQRAVMYADDEKYVDAAIEQFLFYAGFVSEIISADGRALMAKPRVAAKRVAIKGIQPSQFYIGADKLAHCKMWIKSAGDVFVPIAFLDGKMVALDGHTRMRAAMDFGFKSIFVYEEAADEHITHFVKEARRRGICGVADMTILSTEEYAAKWHKYCEDFFATAKEGGGA